MPNYCYFDIHMRGPQEKLKKLCQWFRADYRYDGDEAVCYLKNGEETIPCEHHIGYRVFSFDCFDEDDIKYPDEDAVWYGAGDCAWSCAVCMFEGEFSYCSEEEDKERFAITLPKACAELGVEVELFSYEPGCAFSEHYQIDDKGEILCDECKEWSEIYISKDFSTYSDYSELCEALKSREVPEKEIASFITKEEFDAILAGADERTLYCCSYFENNIADEDEMYWPWMIE